MEEKIQTEVHFTISYIKDLLLFNPNDQKTNTKSEAVEAASEVTSEVVLPSADRFLEVPNLNVIWGLVAALRFASP